MDNGLPFYIVLQKPTIGVLFGLQKGSGSQYEVVQAQIAIADNDLHFNLLVDVRAKSEKYNEPVFKSPFVQGPPLNQFIYIDIGSIAGQIGGWIRRLKIPLVGITLQMIADVKANPKLVLETHVPGTGKDGGPNCATVKPFGGWKVREI